MNKNTKKKKKKKPWCLNPNTEINKFLKKENKKLKIKEKKFLYIPFANKKNRTREFKNKIIQKVFEM